jgi:endoglucanase Acf2
VRLAWLGGGAVIVVVVLAQVRRGPAQDLPIVTVGEASYALRPPPGGAGPPPPVRLGAALAGRPVPTNRFWSSLLVGERPLPQYPHPLAVHPCARGLRIHDPGPSLTTDARGVHGGLPETGGEDLTLGHAGARELTDITLEAFDDWTVRIRLASAAVGLDVTYGHGSPYVYATLEGDGGARVTFADAPTVWAGGPTAATLGVTVRGRHYGLFGPAGSTWSGLDGHVWTNDPRAARHVSLALLPAATPEVLDLFRRHAHAHVTGSRASFRYDPATSAVTTTFAVETRALEGHERATLLALYPHQWAHTDAALLPGLEYRTVRGPMRLVRGAGFATTLTYPGLLPALPAVAPADPARQAALLDDELARAKSPPLDSYWEAKLLGRLATLVPLAEEAGPEQARRLVDALARRLERRFTALDATGAVKADDRFDHDRAWGTLIARPASFGSETSLNDHHLHYGYYLRAAAEVARLDPDWARDERFGGMVRLLVRDIASPDRDDPLFPYLRCFDLYAGHSWAAGLVDSPSGPNLESSSESMNAWSAIALLGAALGDAAMRDLGLCLYTMELAAIEEYWFDVERRTFPPALDLPALAMIWGGKGVLETWFSTEPEALFGINWLPLHGGSLYLGRYPQEAAQVYEALRARRGSDAWRLWPDLVIMYRALSDPDDAARQLAALDPAALTEAGNSRLNLERWVAALRALGHVDRTTTADCPFHAVFERDGEKVHVAYRLPRDPPFVATFSDGATVRCDAPGLSRSR